MAAVEAAVALPWRSRAHRLARAAWPAVAAAQAVERTRVWVKRDDELGGAASGGSKLRKYASYLPAAAARGVRGAVVVGGPMANNTVAAATLLRAAGIRPFPCLRSPRVPGPATPAGNALLWQLAVPPDDVRWMPHDAAVPAMEREAARYAAELEAQGHGPVDVLPEGCNHRDAWPGTLLLADDIGANANDVLGPGRQFDHIFVDAGTGMTAAGLLVGLALSQRRTPTLPTPVVHVVLVAGTAEQFAGQLAACTAAVTAGHPQAGRRRSDEPRPEAILSGLPRFHTYPCERAGRKFGPGTGAAFEAIHRYARTAGILLDPVYSAKLFVEMERIVAADASIEGDVLVVHSGGVAALFGFAERLFPPR